MVTIVTKALVVGSVDFGESDKIVTLFTLEMGTIKAVARGAKRSRKRFGANLEPFSLVSAHLVDAERGGLMRLEQSDLIEPHDGIRRGLDRIAWAAYFTELAGQAVGEGEANPALFRLLEGGLGFLNRQMTGAGLIRAFEMKFLELAGLRPVMDCCVMCRGSLPEKGGIPFSPSKGGALCTICVSEADPVLYLSRGTLRSLEAAARMPWQKVERLSLSRSAARESGDALRAFIRFHLGRDLKSLRFIERMGIGPEGPRLDRGLSRC